MNTLDVLRAVGKALLYGVTTAMVLFAIFVVLSGPSVRERRETNANVRLLVMEAQKNRELVCLAVIRNVNNPASEDPRILEMCAQVGVEP